MPDLKIRMLDGENAAKDRYDLYKRILAEINTNNIDEAKAIIKKDMKIYENEYLDTSNNSEENVIELSNRLQTN